MTSDEMIVRIREYLNGGTETAVGAWFADKNALRLQKERADAAETSIRNILLACQQVGVSVTVDGLGWRAKNPARDAEATLAQERRCNDEFIRRADAAEARVKELEEIITERGQEVANLRHTVGSLNAAREMLTVHATRRFDIAKAALQGLLAKGMEYYRADPAELAVTFADDLIAALEKKS